jgi:predicted nucleic-acid-binding Zn-ribbon protein
MKGGVMGFLSEFKKSSSGAQSRYAIAGKVIVCPHCGGQDFEEGSAQLNTPGLTFFNLDWANRSASLLICRTCSHIEWFLDDLDAL